MKLNCRLLCIALGLLTLTSARAEWGDAVYRDGVFYDYDYHAALIYRYNNDNSTTYVIHSAGTSFNPNSVRIGDWNEFLGGNNYVGRRCMGNPSYSIRDTIIDEALEQINAHYWTLTHWMKPNTSYQSGDGYFRCDALVEYCYEEAGLGICNDALLYPGGPNYQYGQMSAATQTDPYNVSMSYPSSQDPNNPTISSSSPVTLQASASDTHSGLSYSSPFTYKYKKWIDGAWTSWTTLGSYGSSISVSISSPNTVYAWYVVAHDNDSNYEPSAVYYFKYVPPPTLSYITISGATEVNENSGTQYTCTAYYSDGSSVNVSSSASWSENSSYASINSSGYLTTTSVSSDRSCQITATYGGQSDTHDLTIKNVPPTFSYVTISGATEVNENSGSQYTCTAYYSDGSSVNVSSSASWSENSSYATINSSGYLTTGDVSSEQPCRITATSGGQSDTYDLTIKNVLATYTVSYNANEATSGTAPGSQTKTHDETLTLASNSGNLAKTGYTFAGWNTAANGSGTDFAAGATYTVNASVTLYAKWTTITYTVSTSSSPLVGGTTAGGGSKQFGSSCTVTAAAASDYNFVDWTENGTVVSTSANFMFTVTGNRTLTANFTTGGTRVPVYRFWSPVFAAHFFTIFEAEKNDIINRLSRYWTFENVAYYAYSSQVPGTVPLYRFWSPVFAGHFFTIDETEKNNVISRLSRYWTYEGVAYYVHPSRAAGTLPVYRFWSPVFAHHFYTIFETEKNNVINQLSRYWTYEGIAFYAYASGAGGGSGDAAATGAMAAMSGDDGVVKAAQADQGHPGAGEGRALAAELTPGRPAAGANHVKGANHVTDAGRLADAFRVDAVFPLAYPGLDVSAYVYDAGADEWSCILDAAASPAEACFTDLRTDQAYWLEVWAADPAGGTPELRHASWFGQTRAAPEEPLADDPAQVVETEGVGRPVVRIAMPGTEDPLTLTLCSAWEDLVRTEGPVAGGETAELTLPSWNRWYWVGGWRADGELVLSRWMRCDNGQ